MKTEELVLTVNDLRDESPMIPDGATDWESHEISRAWRNAMRAAAVLAEDCANITARLADPDRAPGSFHQGPNHQRFSDLTYALGEYRARLEGAQHRLALDRRRDKATAAEG